FGGRVAPRAGAARLGSAGRRPACSGILPISACLPPPLLAAERRPGERPPPAAPVGWLVIRRLACGSDLLPLGRGKGAAWAAVSRGVRGRRSEAGALAWARGMARKECRRVASGDPLSGWSAPVEAGPTGRAGRASLSRSGADDVRRLDTLLGLLDLELDLFAFGEGAEPIPDDGRVMDEHVVALVLPNESVPFGIIEPLHGPSHRLTSDTAMSVVLTPHLRREPGGCASAPGRPHSSPYSIRQRPRFRRMFFT